MKIGDLLIDESEIVETFVRSSGPGGQNVNKVASAVELRFDARGTPSLPNDVAIRLMKLAGSRLTQDGVIVIFAQVKRTGNKVAFTFWDCVANGGRWPRQKTARDSPLRALYRLYGRAGPLYAIGVPPGGYVEEMAASTYPSHPGAPELTVGNVKASGEVYPVRDVLVDRGGQARCRRDHVGAASAGPPSAGW